MFLRAAARVRAASSKRWICHPRAKVSLMEALRELAAQLGIRRRRSSWAVVTT